MYICKVFLSPQTNDIVEIMRSNCWIIILFLFSVGIKAQETKDLENIDLTQERTIKLNDYSNLSWHSEDSLWYVGKEYKFFNTRGLGTPFFYDEMKLKGSLVFNGKSYSALDLFYDIVKDELVLHYLTKIRGSVFIILNKAWISEFTLDVNDIKYHFIPESYFNNGLINKLPEGFVELAYDGNIKLLLRYSKKLHFEATSSDRFNYIFEQKIYLIKDNKCFDVTKKYQILSVFPDNKNQIKTYLRKSQIHYKKATRSNLISLIQYCEKLS